MAEEAMLTTIDNPYNPFTNFEEWFAYDSFKGYHTCEYLARISINSKDLSDSEQDEIIQEAIDEIIRINPNGLYTRAYAPTTQNNNENASDEPKNDAPDRIDTPRGV